MPTGSSRPSVSPFAAPLCYEIVMIPRILFPFVTLLVACTKSTCPFTAASNVTIGPPTPCLEATVETCLHATLTVRNNCPAMLSLPVEYAVFPNDASADPTVDVVPRAGVHYEVRADRAVSRSATEESYVIPAKLGGADITFRFSIREE